MLRPARRKAIVLTEAERRMYENPPQDAPAKAHPWAKFVFDQMMQRSLTYERVCVAAGVSFWTMKKWRTGVTPDADTIQSVLGALGYYLQIAKSKSVQSTDL